MLNEIHVKDSVWVISSVRENQQDGNWLQEHVRKCSVLE